ncbi:MAG: biotin--[acetyl-CoA-carboxylase] ligase [Acidobacteria bacterium]|nr:biotin--[acetyl-CoA-carboxylase] ligase [Acidobacteriota bacterium]
MTYVHWHDSIDSTMYEAARLADGGCEHGTVVAANEQTAGHGRHGRAWHSEKDAGLYCTLVLRPRQIDPANIPVVTLALGLAAAEAIGMNCDLRWPNDVLIRNRKVCGILTTFHANAVLAGVGINVNHTAFPPDLEPIATSLRIENNGTPVDRQALLERLRTAVLAHCAILEERGPAAIIDSFTRASSYASGRRVRLEDTGDTGVTDGLDASGFLILKRDDGRRITIYAGGVRPE